MLPGILGIAGFSGATAIALVDTQSDAGGSSPHTFTGVNFGPDYTNRVIVVCTLMQGVGAGSLNQSGVTIGGVAAVGDNDGQNLNSVTMVGCGMWAAKPSGSSGNVVITWTTAAADAIGIIVLSVPMSSATHTDSFSPVYTVNSTATTTGTQTLTIPSLGTYVSAAAHRNTNDGDFTAGATKLASITLAGSNMIVGWAGKQPAESNRSFSASWSGATIRGFQGRAFNP